MYPGRKDAGAGLGPKGFEDRMTERFQDRFVSRDHRFSLGVDRRTGRYYLSTPISGINRAAEWEAYFAISEDQFHRFQADPASADGFTEDCRMGRNARLLIYPR
jgi:hypothetical protein